MGLKPAWGWDKGGIDQLRVLGTPPPPLFCDKPSAFEVVAVADPSEARLAEVWRWNASARLLRSGQDLIASPEIDAVVIATPVTTHYGFAMQALQSGKHVLVEKPMCKTAEEARELIRVAKQVGCVLMVDHTFVFTVPYKKSANSFSKANLGVYHISTR